MGEEEEFFEVEHESDEERKEEDAILVQEIEFRNAIENDPLAEEHRTLRSMGFTDYEKNKKLLAMHKPFDVIIEMLCTG